jgi:hemolysin activation/secretion protein
MSTLRCAARRSTNPLGLAILAALAPLAALLPGAILAAEPTPPPVAPDSGTILQQLTPAKPAAPASSATGLTVEQPDGTLIPAGATTMVKRLDIRGNTRFEAATLHALVADAEGKNLDLAQLSAVADRITDYYHRHDYPLARAILPAQTVQDGVFLIQVLEARYGKVTLHNQSHVTDSLLRSTLSPLTVGEVIEQSEMNHVLLLLSDVPKIEVHALIKPGDAVGTSDLDVTALPGPGWSAIASIDDYGNKYTGRTRGGATVSLIDPFAHGDYLSLAALSSGPDLNYGRLSYESTVNGIGTRLGGAYSGLHYKLGDGLESLEGHGTAEVGSLWVKHPLVRSENADLYLQVQYDRLTLHDDLDATALRTDRHLNDGSASLTGDARDALLAGAVSTVNLTATYGQLNFDNGAAETADAATARTRGSFSKWNLNLARQQQFGATDGVYVSFAGQWTGDNLDSSQKMIAGGPYTVRAYDLGALSGDTGELGSAEFQHALGAAWGGIWQACAFFDTEHVVVNRNPWVTGTNAATLSGAGIGLAWSGPHQWSAKLELAARVGAVPTLVHDPASARLWAEINRAF